MKKAVQRILAILIIFLPAALSPAVFADSAQALTVSQYDGSLANYTRLLFTKAEASSSLTDLGTFFGPEMAIDSDDTRPWIEGVTGYGSGEYLLLSFDCQQTIDLMCIRPGFADLYVENSRPASLQASFSDGSSVLCELPDYNGNCYFRLSRPVETSYIKLTIIDVYKGRKCKDTCIAEVSAYNSGERKVSAGQQYRLAEEQMGDYRTVYKYISGDQLSTAIKYYRDTVESISTYEYSPAGSLHKKSVLFPKTQMTLCFHYDSAGIEIERDDTGGLGSQANYNGFCEASETRDMDGRIIMFSVYPKDAHNSGEANYNLRYEYTQDGRISSLFGEGMQIEYQYDAGGGFTRTAKYRFMDSILEQFFDRDGKLLSSIRSVDGVAKSTITYYYDGKGNRLAMQRDDGTIVLYDNEYDSRGLLTAQSEILPDGAERKTLFAYEPIP